MNLTGSVPQDSNLESTQPSSSQGSKWPLAGAVLMAVCPLLVFQSMAEDPWITPRVFILAFSALWIWLTGKRENKPLLIFPILSFLAVVFLTALTSIDPLVSIFGQFYSQFHGLLEMFLCALIYFAFATTDISIEKFGSAILYSSIAVGGWAIAQKYKGIGLQDGRAASGFGSPVYLGNYIALVIPLAWIWIRSNKRILGSMALIFGLISAIAARSRGGLAAGMFGIMVFEYLKGNKKQVVLTAILGTLLVLALHPFHHDSDLGRVGMWEIAIQGWRDHPWLGYGPDTYGLIFRRYETHPVVAYLGGYKLIALQAHNDFLQMLSTMGVAGLFAYLFLFASTLRMLYIKKEKKVTALLAAVWCQAQVNPVHIVILCYLAAFVGTVRGSIPLEKKSLTTLSACFASFVLCFFFFEQSRAIAYESKAVLIGNQSKYVEATQLFHQASVTAPWEIHFQQRELNALWTILRVLDRNQSDNVVNLSLMTARNAVLLHPNDPTAHDMAAHAFKTVAIFKGINTIKQSGEEMSLANHLAPTYTDYKEDLDYIKAQGG